MDVRKTIFSVLDILLLLGALVAVVTINGGEWNTSTTENDAQMSFDCMMSRAPTIPEIVEADAVLTASIYCNQVIDKSR